MQHPLRSSVPRRRNLLFATLLILAALPFGASAACIGKYAYLQSYAGNYIGDMNLLAVPPVAARLAELPASLRRHFERNLDVAGPIDLIGCHLVLSGNAPHMGPEENAIVDLNLYSGAVTLAIHSRGRSDIYLDKNPTAGTIGGLYDAVPGAVQEWAIMADMGFPYQKPASVRVHPPQPGNSQ